AVQVVWTIVQRCRRYEHHHFTRPSDTSAVNAFRLTNPLQGIVHLRRIATETMRLIDENQVVLFFGTVIVFPLQYLVEAAAGNEIGITSDTELPERLLPVV